MRLLRQVVGAGWSQLVCAMAVLCLLGGSGALIAEAATCRQTQTETTVGLANGQVELAFDARTGALVSLRNLATDDEYLKDASPRGNPFRIYVDITKPYVLPASHLGWKGRRYLLDPAEVGAELVETADCELEDWHFERSGDGGVLTLVLCNAAHALRFELEVRLPDDSPAVDCSLAVQNIGDAPQTIMVDFPYLTGLRLGEDASTNLAVIFWGPGAANHGAWNDFGHAYGSATQPTQWIAVFARSLNEGLGLIVMDAEVRNKFLRRHEEASMEVLYFPEERLEPGEQRSYPAARLVVHEGNWRVSARYYREWFSSAFHPRQPVDWMEDLDLAGGGWMPFPDYVAEAFLTRERQRQRQSKLQPEAREPFSFRELPRLYLADPNPCDNKEWAMYNSHVLRSGVLSDRLVHIDGNYYVREDLGGVTALREGIRRVHALGRYATLYVCGDGTQDYSELTLGNLEATWARWSHPNRETRGYPHGYGMCPGHEDWQNHLAEVCKRLLWETGADGIRLDSLTESPYQPCYNPAHHHDSPYDWNKWVRELLRKVRAAMDEVNPQATLWTEHPMDFYCEYCDGVLAQQHPGLDAMPLRLAVPSTYRIHYYGPTNSTGTGIAALNGIGSMCQYLYTGDVWPWVYGPLGIFTGTGPVTRWPELQASLRAAMVNGYPTDEDPVAESEKNWLARLWCSDTYWVMISGHADVVSRNPHLDGQPLAGPLRVRLPELPDSVQQAYEFDILTLEMEPITLERAADGIYVTVKNSFSAVLLPTPDCPPLIQVAELPSAKPGGQVTLDLTAFAPWRRHLPKVAVTISAPGLEVAGSGKVTLPARVQVKVPEVAEPGYYSILVSGDCLPLKRWVKVRVSTSEKDST